MTVGFVIYLTSALHIRMIETEANIHFIDGDQELIDELHRP